MKRLMQSYAMYFNRKYGTKGHVFDSRYVSCLIEDGRYFLEVSRYIHLNPVRASMVRNPLDYKYSSYDSIVSKKENELLSRQEVLDYFKGNQAEQYRMLAEGAISQAVKEAGERIQAAIEFCGYDIPKDKVIISLALGNRRKRGSHYDLAMTIALLQQTDQICTKNLEQYALIGELSLNGRLRPCKEVCR